MIILRCIYIYISINLHIERERLFFLLNTLCMHHIHIHIASKSTLNPARVKQSDRQVTCYSLDAQSIEAPFQSRSVVPENPPKKKKNRNVHRAPHKNKHTWLSIGFPKNFLLQSGCWVKAIEEDCEIVGSLDILLDAPGEVCARDTPF